jgi:hypothetical protein
VKTFACCEKDRVVEIPEKFREFRVRPV